MNEKSSFSVWGVNKSTENYPRPNFQPRMPNYRPRPVQYQELNTMRDDNMIMNANNSIRPNRYSQEFVRPRFNKQEVNMKPKNFPGQDGYTNIRPRNIQGQDSYIRPRYQSNQYQEERQFEGIRPQGGYEPRPRFQGKRFEGPVIFVIILETL